jgi:hypothetical protein
VVAEVDVFPSASVAVVEVITLPSVWMVVVVDVVPSELVTVVVEPSALVVTLSPLLFVVVIPPEGGVGAVS